MPYFNRSPARGTILFISDKNHQAAGVLDRKGAVVYDCVGLRIEMRPAGAFRETDQSAEYAALLDVHFFIR